MAGALGFGGDVSRFELGNQLNPGYMPGQALSQADQEFVAAGGLPRDQLMRFLTDVHYEPSWRREADIDVDYFDGYQLTPEQMQVFQERGLPPLIINLVQSVINSVLGLEAKTRSDCEVSFEDDASEVVAQALNKKMSDAQKGSATDRACSDAYAGQIKAGLGWVEVSDQSNPFLYKYRVNSIHRREIWWDWRDQDQHLDNARYLIRKKWFDNDCLSALLPMITPLLGTRTPLESALSIMEHLGRNTDLAASLDVERATIMDMAEWRDTERRRTLMYEVWYRVWQKGFVVRLPNDTVVEVNPKNYDQMHAIAAGVVRPVAACWPKMRQSFWLGPTRILDQWSTRPHQAFPYVPFWGFREDLSAMPYGLIRAMRCPQDEINARRSKMMALLSARRVKVDADALNLEMNTFQDVANNASSHNSFVVLNPNRKNKDGFEIDSNQDLSAAQLEVLHESKDEIHQVSGIFTAQQGEGRSGQSGYALNTLVEQGTTTLAEINDNYRFGRRKVFELLFSHVKRDSTHEHDVPVGEGKAKKTITLNGRAPGENGQIINDVQMSTAKVVLQDVPATAGYRQQQFMMLSEMTKALPPQVQAFIIDFVIEATDLPDRKRMASRLRQALHLPEAGAEDQGPPPLPPQVQQQIALGQEQLQQQQQVIQELSAKLHAALDSIQLENLKHDHKMEEIDATARFKRLDAQVQNAGKVAIATANADGQNGSANAAGAPTDSNQEDATDAATEQRIMAAIQALGGEIADIRNQVRAPMRSVVRDNGDGTFGVLSVPVAQQAPLSAGPAAAAPAAAAPADVPMAGAPSPAPGVPA